MSGLPPVFDPHAMRVFRGFRGLGCGLVVLGKVRSLAAAGAERRQPPGCAARTPPGSGSPATSAVAGGCGDGGVLCRVLLPPVVR